MDNLNEEREVDRGNRDQHLPGEHFNRSCNCVNDESLFRNFSTNDDAMS